MNTDELQDELKAAKEVINDLRNEVQLQREKHRTTWLQLKQLEHLATKVLQDSKLMQEYLEVIKGE